MQLMNVSKYFVMDHTRAIDWGPFKEYLNNQYVLQSRSRGSLVGRAGGNGTCLSKLPCDTDGPADSVMPQ